MREAIVAVFDTAPHADQAVLALQDANIPQSSIRCYHQDADVERTGEPRPGKRGFWAWLMGENDTTGWRDPTYGDRYDAMYAGRIAAGGHVVAAYVDETEARPVMDILAKQNPISVNEEPNAAPTDAGAAAAGTMSSGTRPAGTVNVSRGDKEEVIPLAEEQVEVSKRRIEEPVRVRRYVVERPVEKTVNLADERVEIERRPASGAAPAGAFEEKVVETRAAHEEPVVNRQAKAAEEVVVRRKEGERTETVRDVERKEQIEVERDGGQAGRA